MRESRSYVRKVLAIFDTFSVNWPNIQILQFRYFEKATKISPIFHFLFITQQLQIIGGRWAKFQWPSQIIRTLQWSSSFWKKYTYSQPYSAFLNLHGFIFGNPRFLVYLQTIYFCSTQQLPATFVYLTVTKNCTLLWIAKYNLGMKAKMGKVSVLIILTYRIFLNNVRGY